MVTTSFNWWWNDRTHRGTPLVVKMENPNNWSMVELEESQSEGDFLNDNVSKGIHNKNTKQLTWVLLLKAHCAAGYITSIGPAIFFLAAVVSLSAKPTL